jgi:hypothetical protein
MTVKELRQEIAELADDIQIEVAMAHRDFLTDRRVQTRVYELGGHKILEIRGGVFAASSSS